uniref:G protein-coupled receptor, class C, group 5, member Ba n=1 Tax=Paramormyrops kingsleyae TaxID=1676925 RepID=A0A3B3SI73_9TELE|nr:G-protein coupled receptor family C group 5 member B-like isoform X1 [Paramormyrops kingsleyae]XP_023656052.1 G-protein coupled receptor family C group 5 member B-like isoform X1 [Paramormyrops kingsleyae]
MIAVLCGFLILSLVGSGFAVDEAPPRDCGTFLKRPYVAFCDLDVVWDVAVMTVASGAALASMILALVLLFCLRRITAPDQRSGVAPLLLLLAGILGLCGLSFAYLIKREKRLCIARRTTWGTLLAMCFGCLVSQGVRLQRLVQGALSPSGRALAGLAALLALVAPAWLLLNVMPEDLAACKYNSLDLGLICTYVLLLLLVALAGAACSLSGVQPQWRCNAAWLLATCLSSCLLWATWLTFYLYGNMALGLSSAWEDREQAVVLAVQAWLLLLVHAAPEAHACMHAAPQPSDPSDSAPSQAQPHLSEASLEEGISLSHWQSRENQGVSVNHSNSEMDTASCLCISIQTRNAVQFPGIQQLVHITRGVNSLYGGFPRRARSVSYLNIQ